MITITDKRHTQCFGELEAGETFLAKDYQGNNILYIKLDRGEDFGAVSLEDGVIIGFKYDDNVLPVEVEANIVR